MVVVDTATRGEYTTVQWKFTSPTYVFLHLTSCGHAQQVRTSLALTKGGRRWYSRPPPSTPDVVAPVTAMALIDCPTRTFSVSANYDFSRHVAPPDERSFAKQANSRGARALAPSPRYQEAPRSPRFAARSSSSMTQISIRSPWNG